MWIAIAGGAVAVLVGALLVLRARRKAQRNMPDPMEWRRGGCGGASEGMVD